MNLTVKSIETRERRKYARQEWINARILPYYRTMVEKKDKKTTCTCWGLLYTYVYAADIFCSLLVFSVSCLPSDWLFCSYVVHQGHSGVLKGVFIQWIHFVCKPSATFTSGIPTRHSRSTTSPWVYIYTGALIPPTTTINTVFNGIQYIFIGRRGSTRDHGSYHFHRAAQYASSAGDIAVPVDNEVQKIRSAFNFR